MMWAKSPKNQTYIIMHSNNVMLHNLTFINRKEELDFLQNAYNSNKSPANSPLRKKRVGKTCLLQHFMKGKKHTYFFAPKGNETGQIKLLSGIDMARLSKILHLPLLLFRIGRAIFMYLYEKAQKERFLLLIGRIPVPYKRNPAVTSIFQKYWDEYLSKTK